jgi:hypothetical protein
MSGRYPETLGGSLALSVHFVWLSSCCRGDAEIIMRFVDCLSMNTIHGGLRIPRK